MGSSTLPTWAVPCDLLEVKDSFGIQRPKYEDPSVIETLDVCRFLFGTQDGQMVQTGEMKISAHEKSKLTGVLTSWLGSAPGAGFDTETLKGKGCMINVLEKTSQKVEPMQILHR